MNKNTREELDVRLKIVVLDFADVFGVIKVCREFNVARSTFIVGNKITIKKGYLDCIENAYRL